MCLRLAITISFRFRGILIKPYGIMNESDFSEVGKVLGKIRETSAILVLCDKDG